MRSVTVQEAKTHLSKLLRDVEAGEQIEIRRGSTPIAVLGPRPARLSFADLKGVDADFGFDAELFASADEEIAREFGMIE